MKRYCALFLSLALLVLFLKTGISSGNMVTYAAVVTQEDAGISEIEKETVSNYKQLNNPNLLRYVEDAVYTDIVKQLDDPSLFVENISAVYVSKEYLDELDYNSQSNIFFGYTLAELDEQFQGKRYVFTLDENGNTTVQALQEYDDTTEKIVKNVATGTGVILICVTVSVATGGSAPAISMIFAASAKSGTAFALSSGVISGAASAVMSGMEGQELNQALKEAALKGSEGFKWGAISGAVAGGAGEAIALHGATLNGLTMNEAAMIQRESGYPLDVIKEFRSMDQYEICKNAGLTTKMVNGKTALVRDIDLNYVDEFGQTNLARMQAGKPAISPSGTSYELHHIGQRQDSTLAILTQEEHRLGDSHKIWHIFGEKSAIDRLAFEKQKAEFWKATAKMLEAGV